VVICLLCWYSWCEFGVGRSGIMGGIGVWIVIWGSGSNGSNLEAQLFVLLCGLTFQSRIEGSVEVGMALLKWPRS
jgi:hypothetical protein